MRLLGTSLSGWGLPFVSAKATHSSSGSNGEVACETQDQCDAIAARALSEDWSVTTRVATAEEVAESKLWSET